MVNSMVERATSDLLIGPDWAMNFSYVMIDLELNLKALECLIENFMLTSEEEVTLLSSLQFAPEDEWLSSFYSCLVRKYDKENTVEAKFKELEQEGFETKSSNQSIFTLKNNTDLLACKAEYYHQCGEYQKGFELTLN